MTGPGIELAGRGMTGKLLIPAPPPKCAIRKVKHLPDRGAVGKEQSMGKL